MAKLPTNPADLADHLLERDPRLQRLSSRIHRQQRRLEKAVGREVFRLYLLLEESVNERCSELVARVWTVARSQGRRQRSRGVVR
jgi:hypothetical protein